MYIYRHIYIISMCTYVSTEFELGQCGESLQRDESDKPLFVFTAFNMYCIILRFLQLKQFERVQLAST